MEYFYEKELNSEMSIFFSNLITCNFYQLKREKKTNTHKLFIKKT